MKNSLWTALTTTLAMTMTDGHAYRSLSDLFKGMKAFKFAADVVNRKWKRPLTVTTSDIYSSNFSYDQIDECSYRSFSELFKASLGYEPFKPAADVVNRKWRRTADCKPEPTTSQTHWWTYCLFFEVVLRRSWAADRTLRSSYWLRLLLSDHLR